MIGRSRSGSASAKRPWALTPALFTRMSSPPSFSRATSSACRRTARSVTSPTTASAVRPSRRISSTTACELFAAARYENLVDARAGQFEGESSSDATRCAGDNCTLILESSACHVRKTTRRLRPVPSQNRRRMKLHFRRRSRAIGHCHWKVAPSARRRTAASSGRMRPAYFFGNRQWTETRSPVNVRLRISPCWAR